MFFKIDKSSEAGWVSVNLVSTEKEWEIYGCRQNTEVSQTFEMLIENGKSPASLNQKISPKSAVILAFTHLNSDLGEIVKDVFREVFGDYSPGWQNDSVRLYRDTGIFFFTNEFVWSIGDGPGFVLLNWVDGGGFVAFDDCNCEFFELSPDEIRCMLERGISDLSMCKWLL